MDEKSDMIDRIQYLITKDSKNKSQILRELHLSTSTLSDWKKGKGNPSSSAIIKLSRYFNVPSDYILFGIEHTENKEISPSEKKWLQVYHMLSESEKQDWPDYLSKLSRQERDMCAAFICGILARRNSTDS